MRLLEKVELNQFCSYWNLKLHTKKLTALNNRINNKWENTHELRILLFSLFDLIMVFLENFLCLIQDLNWGLPSCYFGIFFNLFILLEWYESRVQKWPPWTEESATKQQGLLVEERRGLYQAESGWTWLHYWHCPPGPTG